MKTQTRLEALERAAKPAEPMILTVVYDGDPEPEAYRVVEGERFTVRWPIYDKGADDEEHSTTA